MSKLGNLISRCLRNAQRLFHMLVGLAFLVLAMAGAAVSVSEWQYYLRSPSVGLVRVILFASLHGAFDYILPLLLFEGAKHPIVG